MRMSAQATTPVALLRRRSSPFLPHTRTPATRGGSTHEWSVLEWSVLPVALPKRATVGLDRIELSSLRHSGELLYPVGERVTPKLS